VICTAPSQSIPAGEEVTLPCPSPAVVMDKVNISGSVGGVVVPVGGVIVGGVVVAVVMGLLIVIPPEPSQPLIPASDRTIKANNRRKEDFL